MISLSKILLIQSIIAKNDAFGTTNRMCFLKILVLSVVRTASTYLNSLMLVKNKERSFRSAQTASISLNSVELSEFTSLRDIEKATGFGGSYREIIMKKF